MCFHSCNEISLSKAMEAQIGMPSGRTHAPMLCAARFGHCEGLGMLMHSPLHDTQICTYMNQFIGWQASAKAMRWRDLLQLHDQKPHTCQPTWLCYTGKALLPQEATPNVQRPAFFSVNVPNFPAGCTCHQNHQTNF
jgi:hypothetical protein